MGFNKRFVTSETIKTYLEGDNNLKSLFKADALIFMDNQSSKVYEMYQKGLSDNEIKQFLKESYGQETT
jgi:hypothetical protein